MTDPPLSNAWSRVSVAGEADGYFDVHQYIAMCKTHYDKVGLGSDLIDKLMR